ncbi:condensation domain-containing protein [Kitasatospora sp. NPDC048365]|uniref:condensation domain-containing protein n=1 Tax=Kitasatospora sp. NPDC048365 TaxID=3364050 RepID=UPI00371F63F0
MSAEQQVGIVVHGASSGTGEATWGQRAISDKVAGLGADAPRYNLRLAAPVDPGMPAAAVLDALTRLLHLHEALRTRLLPAPDGLRQQVDAEGGLAVAVRVSTPDRAADEATALLAELGDRPFDCAVQWPLRVGLVEVAGLVRHLVLVLSHTACDGWGMRRLVRDLTELSLGRGVEQLRAERPSRQPLQEAALQHSERGAKRDAAARRHWRDKLAAGPRRLFPAPDGAAPDRPFPNAVLRSPRLARAVARVAAAHRVSEPTVLLAAGATMLCRLSGAPDAMFQVVVANRFTAGTADAVTTMAQQGLFHLPGPGPDFADTVRRTQGASLAAYRHAGYDAAALERDIAGLDAADHSCWWNDTRDPLAALMDGPTAPADGPTELAWPQVFPPRENTTFAVDVNAAPGALELAMTADSALLSRRDMADFLHGIEELVLTEAGKA